jgi:sialate O-acetylesterase
MNMTHLHRGVLAATALLLAATGDLQAKVTLPAFFSDGMVVQQQTNVRLWGSATPGKQVRVTAGWAAQTYQAKADAQGKWQLELPTPAADGKPYTLSFDDGERLTLHNILLGELWLCSGQSNMEMPMKGFTGQPVEGATMDILKSRNPQIRLFTAKRTATLTPQDDVTGAWSEASPRTVAEFSATAYYFGRLLNQLLDVPVGLLVTSWGGSSCEAWMDAEMLSAFPEAKIPRRTSDIGDSNRTPTLLYNGMLHPLVGLAMRGVIWYQGESNRDRYQTYAAMFGTLIRGWRALWKQGEFPFYYCQIAPYKYDANVSSAYLREAQAQVEFEVPNTGMAVLMDAGLEHCIHPSKKCEAGERLALLALTKTYGFEGISGESPCYDKLEIKENTAIVHFKRSKLWVNDKNRTYTSALFTIAGDDKVFYPAKAEIRGNRIVVSSDKVANPVAVRYAFENYVQGDLFGGNGLPLSSFRTDNW